MLKKEQILRILKKYGFYSLNRAPYLYQNKEEIGVYFLWPHKLYGTLERILFFYDEESLEEEVFKYWWFLANKNKIDIEISFNDYESLSPKVSYIIDQKPYTASMMREYNGNMVIPDADMTFKMQLSRTATIIIKILHEKFKLQNEVYFQVADLQESLKQYMNFYQKKLNEFNKVNQNGKESYEVLMDNIDDSDTLADTLNEELSSIESVEDLQTFISSLFNYLIIIDSNEVHLQNIYLLNRYPFEIEDLKKKIAILDNALQAKKRIFKQKQNVLDLLEEVDETSSCKKMMNVNLYVEKEKQKIEKKYKPCTQVDMILLGDYLLDLEKMNIEVPAKIESVPKNKFIKKEEVIAQMKAQYEKLSKKEQAACHVATSFLKECLNTLQELEFSSNPSLSDILSQLIANKKIDDFKEALHYLDYYLNANIRVKYFSILKIDSLENFIQSLLLCLEVLEKINFSVEQSFIGYYNSKKKEILTIYLNNLSYLEPKESYIVTIMPYARLYYSPVQIVKPLDIVENKELIARESDLLFTLKHRISIQTIDDKITVVKYNKDKVVKKKDIIVITDIKEKNKCIYYKDVLKSIESE